MARRTERAAVRVSALGLCALITAGTAAPAADGESAPRERFDTVVVDAGHGGEDEGALGTHGLVEKELALDVSRRLAARLREAGLEVVMTRDADVFVPLETRTAIANDARGDLFVSVHANAADDAGVHGVETFFLSLDASDDSARRVAARENAAFGPAKIAPIGADPLVALLGDLIATEHLRESSEFAALAQRGLAGLERLRSRGVKQAPFVVLSGVQMPASLVEIGFVTSPRDGRELARSRGRARIVEALAGAVREFGWRYDARRGVGGR